MPLRDFVETTNFKHDFEMYRGNYPELDQIYEAAREVLLDKPAIGKSSEIFRDFRSYLTYPVDNTPAFWIYYSYDTEHIYLHAIKKVEF